MPLPHDYLADYRTLGCAPGCSEAELEQAWRQALRRVHPDRAAPGEQAEAAEQTQTLNTAYRRLRAFSRDHGRLPGSGRDASGWPGTPQPVVSPPMPAAPTAPPRRSARRWLAVACILLVAALGLSWSMHDPVPAKRAKRNLSTAAGEQRVDADFGLDSHADEVLELAGEPVLRHGDEISGELWEYGPSFVRFRARRVVDWYSSPMRPLPVAAERPAHGAPITAPPSRK